MMNLAFQVATRSPDPKTQVGAVLTDQNFRVVGTGYNGPPANFDDSTLDWGDRNDHLYRRIVHAEMNAILYSGSRYDDRSTLFVTMSPCQDCMKLIAAAGIKKVYYNDRYKDFDLVEQLAREFGVSLEKHKVTPDIIAEAWKG